VWPCSACTLYTTTSWRRLNPARTILPGRSSGLTAFLKGQRRRPPRIPINERVHWSVKERLGWDKTLSDEGGPCRYAPANLPEELTALTQPLPLEVDLLRPDSKREGGRPCPMRAAGLLPCQCEKRDVQALTSGASSTARATSPIAA
jgi:hypothetical protein